MKVADAMTVLQNSLHARMGPFTYDESGVVTAESPRKGQRAHRFKGAYHRHHFYVFYDGTVAFLNDEDDRPLWGT
jgi:hypothetical protein